MLILTDDPPPPLPNRLASIAAALNLLAVAVAGLLVLAVLAVGVGRVLGR